MILADGGAVNSRVLPFARERLSRCSTPLTHTITTITTAMTIPVTATRITMATPPTSAASVSPPC
jgi:hypothetical protein